MGELIDRFVEELVGDDIAVLRPVLRDDLEGASGRKRTSNDRSTGRPGGSDSEAVHEPEDDWGSRVNLVALLWPADLRGNDSDHSETPINGDADTSEG